MLKGSIAKHLGRHIFRDNNKKAEDLIGKAIEIAGKHLEVVGDYIGDWCYWLGSSLLKEAEDFTSLMLAFWNISKLSKFTR